MGAGVAGCCRAGPCEGRSGLPWAGPSRFLLAPAAPAQGPAQPRSHGRAPRGKPGGERAKRCPAAGAEGKYVRNGPKLF